MGGKERGVVLFYHPTRPLRKPLSSVTPDDHMEIRVNEVGKRRQFRIEIGLLGSVKKLTLSCRYQLFLGLVAHCAGQYH